MILFWLKHIVLFLLFSSKALVGQDVQSLYKCWHLALPYPAACTGTEYCSTSGALNIYHTQTLPRKPLRSDKQSYLIKSKVQLKKGKIEYLSRDTIKFENKYTFGFFKIDFERMEDSLNIIKGKNKPFYPFIVKFRNKHIKLDCNDSLNKPYDTKHCFVEIYDKEYYSEKGLIQRINLPSLYYYNDYNSLNIEFVNYDQAKLPLIFLKGRTHHPLAKDDYGIIVLMPKKNDISRLGGEIAECDCSSEINIIENK